MLSDAELVAFVATADAARAVRFYGEVLGLPVLERTPFACVFRAPNALLRVAVVDELTPARHTVLGWTVPDIRAAAAELVQRRIPLLRYDGLDQDELGIWRAPSGAEIAWFADPDGNVLSLTEL
jgi:catechol 2,3-dioxygenase-like lactoylglutathione lyase family enzyme